ncbi:hypothetical protein LIER_41966 [Lithospermum erythrorhizon]|uniref:Secreted protein n=1 Tax=Lithospermum erythrorhizon TaxID=34254 RepID=A0AAV3RH38_LITER
MRGGLVVFLGSLFCTACAHRSSRGVRAHWDLVLTPSLLCVFGSMSSSRFDELRVPRQRPKSIAVTLMVKRNPKVRAKGMATSGMIPLTPKSPSSRFKRLIHQ